MTFLQFELLWRLAPFLMAPLLIHLLSRRLTRPLEFPSVRHLKVSLTRSAAIYRWRHWLFLVLRTLLLAMLLMAFLLPLRLSEGSLKTKQSRSVFLVIDNSLSMEHTSGGQSARQRAIHESERILDTLRQGDSVNILRVHSHASPAFPVPSESFGRARDFLAKLPEGTGAADMSQANHLVAGMAFESPSSVEIYYLSDFQRTDWANVDFRPLPETARVFFVDVGASQRDNRALTKLSIDGELIAGALIAVDVELSNYAAKDTEANIHLSMDGRPLASASVYVAPNSIAHARIPLALPQAGKHLIQVEIGSDSLEQDNALYAVVEVSEKQEVLLLTGPDSAADRGIDYLEAALNPFIGGAGSIRPRRLHLAELTPADLASVTKVFICQAGAMESAVANLIAEFLFAGGGVVWFLDSPADATNLPQMSQALGHEGTALQLGAWHSTESLANARQVIGGDFRSPFLDIFSGTRVQDLGKLEVYDNYSAAFTGKGKKLLNFADGSPAMTEQTHGIGQLILINFSPNAKHSNLAKLRFFPVWIQTLVHAFGSEPKQALYHTIGQRVVTNLWKNDISHSQFTDPDGQQIETKVEVIGQRANVSFPTTQLGIYQLSAGDELIAAFAVNPPPEEADLRPIPRQDLPARQGTPEQTVLLDGTTTDFNKTVFGHPLFPWFIGAALLFALVELALHQIVHHHRPKISRS
jgi:hypothetical protein